MTVSYFTHVRRLGDGSANDPCRHSFEFLPDVDGLLLYMQNRVACIDFDGVPIEENLGRDLWLNTQLIAYNNHIAVIYTSSEDADFEKMFMQARPIRPYAATLEAYVEGVAAHRSNLIADMQSIDENFNPDNIQTYINNLNFIDLDFDNIRNWMLDILSGDNVLYPSHLLVDSLWSLSKFREVFEKWTLESDFSDINKMFKAFEIYNMDCILEVI